MNGYHTDNMLEMGKAKMQQFHQEQAASRIAQEARLVQSDSVKIVVNKLVGFFKPLLSEKDDPQPQSSSKTATEST